MAEKSDSGLQQRVERLETIVAELQTILKQTQESSVQAGQKGAETVLESERRELAGAPLKSSKPLRSSPQRGRKSFEIPQNLKTSEYWLNKIGIGLLLFGIAFLFKYSIDKGWLTPPVRVGFGLFLGLVLVFMGVRMSAAKRHFSQVLTGGGIAAFYISGFAAFQLFSLVSHPVAFAFMACVTILAFILSLKHNGVALAIIAAIGGLGTPFLLYTDTGNLPGLVGYTCLVLSGSSAMYFFHGWRSLLWTSVLGGWLVFLIGLNEGLAVAPDDAMLDRWSLQLGIVFNWLAFWVLPLTREYTWAKNAPRWPGQSPDSDEKPADRGRQAGRYRYLHLLSVSTPLIALWMSMSIWALSNQTWGWVTLGGAIVYAIVSWRLSGLDMIKGLSYTHSLISLLLLTQAFYLFLDGEALLFVLATEAAVLHFIARRLPDRRVAISAHLLFGLVAIWLLHRLSGGQTSGTAVFNMPALTDFWVLLAASVVAIRALSTDEKKVYLFLAHLALLGWFLRELAVLPNGQGYVTIAWGIYALILFVVGLRMNFNKVRAIAMGTLLLVVGKLFLVDLAEVETIWRVLLFLGFGGLFLLLSYYFQALWKSNDKSSNS
jgi:uncharacterized membrane protein